MKNGQTTRVQKLGHSLAIIVPASLARFHKIERGDQVVFGHIDDHTFAVRKLPDLFYNDITPKK